MRKAALLLVFVVGLPLSAAAQPGNDFDRRQWPHWRKIAVPGCRLKQSVRDVALARDAVTLQRKTSDPCSPIIGGTWRSPYSGALLHLGEVQLDHTFPLAWVWEHTARAQRWDKERRKTYANDLRWRGHLVVMEGNLNAAKGARGPADWRPPLREAWCDYALTFAAVAFVEGFLPAPSREREAAREMLATCR